MLIPHLRGIECKYSAGEKAIAYIPNLCLWQGAAIVSHEWDTQPWCQREVRPEPTRVLVFAIPCWIRYAAAEKWFQMVIESQKNPSAVSWYPSP
jgi:hypothetical protein